MSLAIDDNAVNIRRLDWADPRLVEHAFYICENHLVDREELRFSQSPTLQILPWYAERRQRILKQHQNFMKHNGVW